MTTPGELLDHTPLTFGKHKGKTPAAVAEVDPGYVVWMYDTWKADRKAPMCSKVLYDECKRDAADKPRYYYERDDRSDGDKAMGFDQYDVDPDLGDR
jgi:hypothetical protein